MTEPEFFVTHGGYERIQRELQDLETDLQNRIEQLREFTDDSARGADSMREEGARFDAITMKEHVEERVGHLRFILDYAKIRENDPNPTQIDPGERVTLWDFSTKSEVIYDLLSSPEVTWVDVGSGVRDISVDSPVGQALIGKQVGDIIEIDIPDGKAKYAIRKIEEIPNESA